MPYRQVVTLSTPISIQIFNLHAPRLLSSGSVVRHLNYTDNNVPQQILRRLMSHLSRKLKSIVIPGGSLSSLHIHELLNAPGCRINKVVVHCLEPFRGDSTKRLYELGWGDLNALRYHDSVEDLTIYGTTFDHTMDMSPIVELPAIKRVHLHDVSFQSRGRLKELLLPLVPNLKHLVLTHLDSGNTYSLAAIEICEILGQGLLSLKVDSASLGTSWGGQLSVEAFFASLPILESLDLDGATAFKWATGGHNTSYSPFMDLPGTLKHCRLGKVSWKHARCFIQRMADLTYLPYLASPLILSLYPEVWLHYREEIDAYYASSRTMHNFSRIRSVLFEIPGETKAEKMPYTLL